MEFHKLTLKEFKKLPLVIEGESKEVRYLGDGLVAIRLKPTVYSYTHNRSGIIKGSDIARLEAIKLILPILKKSGIKHSYQAVTDKFIISKFVLQPDLDGELNAYVPKDISKSKLNKLPKAPPIEVIVKDFHCGTPKHRYYKFNYYKTRDSQTINSENKYPERIIRFDWRNPMLDDKGNRLADEVLPDQMANWFIDVRKARKTASKTFTVLKSHFLKAGLELWDICFFISEDGSTVFGEISPDCMRVRTVNGNSLDKDIWRRGGSAENVLEKWENFVKVLEHV